MSSVEQRTVYLKPHQRDGVQEAILGKIDFTEFAQTHGEEAADRLRYLAQAIRTNPRFPINFSFERSRICQPNCDNSGNCDGYLVKELDEKAGKQIVVGKTMPAAFFFHVPTGKKIFK